MKEALHPTALKRVLCVRLDNMGDVLMTGPAMRAVKETHPGATITLLTSEAGSRIAPFLPEVNEVIPWESPWVRTYGESPEAASVEPMIRLLQAQQFDAAFIFTVYTQSALPSALLAFLASIPIRAAHCHENPYHLLTHWIPDPEPNRFTRHEVERQLALVRWLGCDTDNEQLAVRIPTMAFEAVWRQLSRRGIDPAQRWILVHPGCSEERRRYRKDGFVAAARELRDRYELPIIVTGSASERPLADEVAVRIGDHAVSLAGQTGIGELCALISLSALLISGNTVTVHIAAATGTPVVDIYARTNPQHTPWMVPSRVLYFDVPCRDCERGVCGKSVHPPLQGVSPREIVYAAGELLTEVAAPGHRTTAPRYSGTNLANNNLERRRI